MEFPLRFKEVSAAGETKEGIRTGRGEGWRSIALSGGGLFQPMSDAG